MKKLLAVFLCLVFTLSVACAEAATIEDAFNDLDEVFDEYVEDYEDEYEDEESEPAPDPDFFSGTWLTGRYAVEIDWEEIGYRILVSLANTESEFTEWEYSGFYHEEEKTIVTMPFGMKTEVVYGEDGAAKSWTTVYEDGSAIFGFDEEGRLIWTDEKENAGEGLAFVKVNGFDGVALSAIGKVLAEGINEGLTEEERADLYQEFIEYINNEVDSKITFESILKELEDAEVNPETINQLQELKDCFDNLQKVDEQSNG